MESSQSLERGEIMKIVYTLNAVESHIENRTWKERLFTLPWKTFKKHRIIYTPAILQFWDQILVHPALKVKLEWQMEQQRLQYDPSTIGLRGW